MSQLQVIYLPLDVATRPATGQCLAGRFWVTHPKFGLVFMFDPTLSFDEQAMPQCTSIEVAAEMLQQQQWPEHGVTFQPVVFLEHAKREQYRHIIRLRKAA